MHLDRTIAPDFKVVSSVTLPDPATYILDNGINLHVINIGEQPVIRIECIFEAGTWFESQIGASYFAIKMLPEGVIGLKSQEISEAFEKLGAFTEMTHTSDRIGIVVYCLSRFLPDALPLIDKLIHEAVVPQKELDELRNITIQNLRVNKEKNAYLATTAFRAKLFSTSHPYGQSQEETNIANLSIDAIRAHYDQFVKNGKFAIVLAGQVGEDDVKAVNDVLGKSRITLESNAATYATSDAYKGSEVVVEKAESIQSSIRMGRVLFNRKHPDYFKLLVTNEIFGGYFGSRLMKNIREEKGLTYGISSHLVTLRHEGYLMIGTDVKREFTQQTVDEIRKEILKLQNEPVGDDELTTVKNFMSGEFAGSLNTAFEVADRQKILLLDEMDKDFFSRYIERIHATTSHDVMDMANQYLNPDDMALVIAGGR